MPLRCCLFIAVVSAALTGCLPVELDVTPQGELVVSRQEGWFLFDPGANTVRKIRATTGNRPVFARVSPDGKSLATVEIVRDGLSEYDLRVGPLVGGEVRTLLRVRNPLYLVYDPAGAALAVSRMSVAPHDKDRPGETLEVVRVDGSTGDVRVLQRPAGPLVRWRRPTNEVLVVAPLSPFPDPQAASIGYVGMLRLIDVETGAARDIAQLLSRERQHFDVSRDGSRAVVCCQSLVSPGAAIDAASWLRPPGVFLLDLTTGDIRALPLAGVCAAFSPPGDALLVGGVAESGAGRQPAQLSIVDLASGDVREIAADAVTDDPVDSIGGPYPGWIDDRRVFYFVERATYGTQGTLSLVIVDRDGRHRRCVQPLIDRIALESELATP